MKKYSLLFFVICIAFGQGAKGQDYIITWENDTIACKLPGSSNEVGLKPRNKYEDGYQRIAAVFADDSMRVINAGEIKGYSRKKHGKRLLCDGFFEAKQIIFLDTKKRTLVDERKDTEKNKPWVFMNRLIEGKYASLYIVYQLIGNSYESAYYLSRYGIEAPNTVISIYSRKRLVDMLSDEDIANEMKNISYRKSSKGFSDIVIEYNRLKVAAAR